MKFLIADKVSDILTQKLENFGIECHFIDNLTYDNALLIIENYDGIIIRSKFPIDKPLLKKGKNLKCVGRVGSGMENIDVEFASQLNIACFNSPEGNRNAVAEHALGMLLALLNNICKSFDKIKNGKWLREENRGSELKGKTVAIIGYGNTGTEFCKKFKKNYGSQTIIETSLEKIQEEADVISFHIPLTNETHYYLNKNFINNCKKPFYLINTSRGSIVNTKDLLNGLIEKKVIGAALDVIEYEDSSFEKLNKDQVFKKLIKLPNVIITPHIAGWTKESKILLAEVLADKIIEYFKNASRK